MDDPLYQLIVPDSSVRLDVLNIFFEHYLEMMYPYSDVWTTSERMEAVALVFHSERFDHTYKARFIYGLRIVQAIIKSRRVSRFIGWRGFLRGLNILHSMSSAWLERLGDRSYHHLDMLVVQARYRGQGYVTTTMDPLLKQCQSDGHMLTLETQNPDNLPIYERYGLRVVETLPLKSSPLQQYCMVYDPMQLI